MEPIYLLTERGQDEAALLAWHMDAVARVKATSF